MGILKKISQTRFGTTHDESYSKIQEIYIDLKNERVRANVATYTSLQARLDQLDPLDINTYTFTGKDFNEILESTISADVIRDGEPPLEEDSSPEDPLQGVIINLNTLISKKLYNKINKNGDFADGTAIIEESVVEGGKLKAGIEISNAIVLTEELVKGVDYTYRGIEISKLKKGEDVNGNTIPLNL